LAFHSHFRASSPSLPALPTPLSTLRSFKVIPGHGLTPETGNAGCVGVRTRPDFLQTGTDAFQTLDLLAVGSHHVLLGCSCFPEDITVATEKYVILIYHVSRRFPRIEKGSIHTTLVVQRNNLPAGQLGLGREQGVHRLGSQETQRGCEAIEEKFRLQTVSTRKVDISPPPPVEIRIHNGWWDFRAQEGFCQADSLEWNMKESGREAHLPHLDG
jgi:hypothetical protein